MNKKLMIGCLSLFLALNSLSLPQASWAQANAPTNNTTTSELTGTRKQIATIIFAGLAGAILGLSTLSFYGRPQEKLSNIAIGFAVGIIGGVIYTTYQVARSPYESFQAHDGFYSDELSKRLVMGSDVVRPTVGWQWTF